MNSTACKCLVACFLTASAFGFSPANAGEYSYFCNVENVYTLSDNGLIEKNLGSFADAMRGELFYVDRKTGNVTGKQIPAFRPDRYSVLLPGYNGNSFKSYFQGFHFVSYLEVYEYRDGKRKPFVLHEGTRIYAGLCE